MTVRVTTLSAGSGTSGSASGSVSGLTKYYMGLGQRGELLHEPATPGLVSYYGAVPGEWHGRGAETLGLSGEVRSGDFAALLEGGTKDGLLLGRRFNDTSARAFDTTFSLPKDVSVLWALADPDTRATIESAFTQSVNAVLDGVERRAVSRMRVEGEIVPVATNGITVAKVFEHTSRAGDPALHCHAIIFSKTECADGVWRALDARELKWDQQALSAQFHRGFEAELSTRLGVEWGTRTQWAAAPLAGFPGGLAETFSARTGDVEAEIERRVGRFETDMGRSPTARETHRLQREAVTATRPDKHAATAVLDASAATSFHGLWQTKATDTGFAIDQVLTNTLHRTVAIPLSLVDMQAVINEALRGVSAGRSSWRVGELSRELSRALPSGIALTADGVVSWSWDQAEALCAEHCIDLTQQPGHASHMRRYTTETILTQEHSILDFVDQTSTRADHRPNIPDLGEGSGLSLPQQQAASRLAGVEPIVIVEGPAGTGKTTSLTTGVRSLQGQGRFVFGVAPSAQAASVLSKETGIETDSIAKLLYEHQRPEGPKPAWVLPTKATLIVDEAGMASTPDLAALASLAAKHDWRLVLVGDPRQLSAVGRGGMLDHLIRSRPDLVTTLDTVHRFKNIWEQDASLRLRRGDTTVISEYDTQNRVVRSDDPLVEAVRVWDQARATGSTALMAPDNDTVEQLNALAQQVRMDRGELSASTAPGRSGGIRVGDQVVTRLNDRRLGVKNREAWTVTNIRGASIGLVNRDGVTTVPKVWAVENLELGYAATAHGRQGATVDVAIAVHTMDHGLDREGLYVAMTRGRLNNLIITDHADPVGALEEALTRSWGDTPAISHTPVEKGLLEHNTPHQPELVQQQLDIPTQPDIPAQSLGVEPDTITPEPAAPQAIDTAPTPEPPVIQQPAPQPPELEQPVPEQPIVTGVQAQTPSIPTPPPFSHRQEPESEPVVWVGDQLRDRLETLNTDLDAAQHVQQVATTARWELEPAVTGWQNQASTAQQRINHLQDRVGWIDNRLGELDANPVKRFRNRDEFGSLTTERRAAEAELTTMRRSLTNSRDLVDKATPTLVELRNTQNQAQRVTRSAETRVQETKTEILDTVATSGQRPQPTGPQQVLTRTELRSLAEQRTGLEQEFQAAGNGRGTMRRVLIYAQNEVHTLSDDRTDLTDEIRGVDAQVESLSSSRVSRFRNREQIESLGEQRAGLVVQVTGVDTQLDKAGVKLERVKAGVRVMDTKCTGVERSVQGRIDRVDGLFGGDVRARVMNMEATLWADPAATAGMAAPTVGNLSDWFGLAAKFAQHEALSPGTSMSLSRGDELLMDRGPDLDRGYGIER